MHSRAQFSPARAFTLIEILGVIAIIAILMALLFPALSTVFDRTRRAKALADVHAIVNAVGRYQTDYGKFPNPAEAGTPEPATTSDTLVGDAAAGILDRPNALLFCILRAIPERSNVDHEQNPRKTVYLEANRVSNPDKPKSGFQDDASTGTAAFRSFFDPWGRQYSVVMDTNGDNAIDVSQQYTDQAGPSAPRVGVGAFSLGTDRQLGNLGNKQLGKGMMKSDDLVSW